MDEELSAGLDCQVSLEYLDAENSLVRRKVNYRKCTLRLIRNEFREIFLSITEKRKQVLLEELKCVTVHKKFMTEGMATIKFGRANLSVFISNSSYGELLSFLRVMSIKIANNEGCVVSAKKKLLSNAPHCLEDISPLSKKDYQRVKSKLGGANKTPIDDNKGLKRSSAGKSDIKAKRNCLIPNLEQSLTDDQKEILQAAKDGHNIFFTGSAGTGKSYVLRSIIRALPPGVTFATASTAVAACQIRGMTLHQFAGVGRGEGSLDHLMTLASRPSVMAVWKKCQHLIIDEISMVHGSFFEKLEHISRKVRDNEKPFGGIQLILCGDFFQLPPVGKPVLFCFQTKAWDRCITKIFELKTIHRQSDPVLINILQSIRVGCVTDDMAKQLQETASQNIEKNGILATRLCTHTAESISINKRKLEELQGEVKTYTAIDKPEGLSSIIDKQCRVRSTVTLKIGAQVMLLKNINVKRGLVNGARGVVIKFDGDNLPVVQFNSLVYKVEPEKFTTLTSWGLPLVRTQIPLTLAWAFSIHKSQGLTLDCIELSLTRVFEAGHAYVALSRVKSLQCLRVLDFSSKQVWANGEVLRYYEKLKKKMENGAIL